MSVKINVGGVGIDKTTYAEAIEKISELLRDGRKHFIVTPYSEMILFAMKDPVYRETLNQADMALPDGIGVVWAAKFLSLKSANFFQTIGQFIYTLFAIIFFPKYVRGVVPEQVTGSRLIYKLAELAAANNFSIALIGGVDQVAELAATKLKKLNPDLKVTLAWSPPAFDKATVARIADSNSDILLIAYSPPKQEKWLAANLSEFNVKLAMGLGGTFDYVAGKRFAAPNFMHYMGLEWLWRLVTQPWRLARMWNAVPVFALKILTYKLHARKN